MREDLNEIFEFLYKWGGSRTPILPLLETTIDAAAVYRPPKHALHMLATAPRADPLPLCARLAKPTQLDLRKHDTMHQSGGDEAAAFCSGDGYSKSVGQHARRFKATLSK